MLSMSDLEAEAQSSETAAADPNPADEQTHGGNGDIESFMAEVEALQQIADEDTSEADLSDESEEESEGDASEEASEESEEQAEESEQEEEESGEADDSAEGEEDEPKSKPPQYRFRPENEVEELAFDIRKRAVKAGKPMPLKEALAQAEQILNPEKETSEEEGSANGLPSTVEDATALLKQMREERREALSKEMDFEKVAELDDKIEDLREHIAELKVSTTSKEAEAQQARLEEFESAKARTVELYPDVTQKDSPLVQKMHEIDAALKENGDDLFYSPEKPLKLAQMAARELGIAPRTAAKATKPATPAAKRPPAKPQIASGAARTTQQQSGQLGGKRIADIKTEEDYLAVVESLVS